jgi:uncharacterized membrane protein
MENLALAATEYYLLPAAQLIGAAIVTLGILSTVLRFVLFLFGSKKYYSSLEEIQRNLARYLLLGLTVQVGVDILATLVTPTIEELGFLAGIVLLRAALSYSLTRDLQRGTAEAPATNKPST